MNNQKTVTVVLKTNHTHEGVKREPGSTLEVHPIDAGWLISNGVAEVQHPNAEEKPVNSKK
ncbi:DUF7210 family protein [Undibacterium sp. Xuan67W]|uniref:DUF7210 family protein n=1 Tax=Undibacterium sp. Xuan67W TaxID=3413057 RepID=UPI003BF27BC6